MSLLKKLFLIFQGKNLRLKPFAMLKLYLTAVIFAIWSSVYAQNIDKWIAGTEKQPVEKIYIQTDGENYFHGDSIWFKVYITDSRSGRLIPSTENVYVKLIDDKGNTAAQTLLLAVNGQAAGQLWVTSSLKPGNYLIQAYTSYLVNFGTEACFYKKISVSRISGNTSIAGSSTGLMVADVQFMPEGGVLLANVNNIVAFKAINRMGIGVQTRGTVKDEKGSLVTSYATDYKGMGILFLTPELGKKYTAYVDGFSSFSYVFEPVISGVKIQLVNHTNSEVILNIAGNTVNIANDTFYLACMNRGEVLFYNSFTTGGMNKVVKYANESLKPGINRLVLLDKNLNPVSERLLFSRNFDLNTLLIEPNSKMYNKRDEVFLRITEGKFLNTDDFSNLSMAVVHELAVPSKGFSKNILSQLLVDSELNGFVESSADLFTDYEISSDAKLRLIMLTNGYSSYVWNTFPAKTERLKYRQEAGITLKGTAKNTLSGANVDNGEITFVIEKDNEMAFLTQKTNSEGRFAFQGLLFNDSATVYVQAKKESGKMNTDVILDSVFLNMNISEFQLQGVSQIQNPKAGFGNVKYQVYNEARKLGQKGKKTKNIDNNGQIGDGHFRLYKEADFVLEVNNSGESYGDVIDYMVGKIPGVDINGNDIRIRGAGSFGADATPLFLIDGVSLATNTNFNLPKEVTHETGEPGDVENTSGEQLVQTVRSMPLNDIEKIEVLKSAQNLAVFGTKGSNGVIAIYTRRGKISNSKQVNKGIIEHKIAGYAKYREFYSPVFLPENNTKRNNLKTLLYWNPNIITKNGNSELRFFSSDLPGKYYVFVEGIDNNGRICNGTAEFEIQGKK